MSALELSKYIVTKCANDKCPITNLQLQKILYYIQKDYLSRNELAFDDLFEAWQFGPVIREVYYYFCGNGAMPIISRYNIKINKNDKHHIDPIIKEKRVLEPWDMVQEVHKSGGAYDYIYANGKGNRHIIPLNIIKEKG